MDYERRDDKVLTELNQRFTDFLDRYERDWQHTQEWRQQHDRLIEQNSEFISEFKPIYKRAMVCVVLIVTGSLGIAIRNFWEHVGWK